MQLGQVENDAKLFCSPTIAGVSGLFLPWPPPCARNVMRNGLDSTPYLCMSGSKFSRLGDGLRGRFWFDGDAAACESNLSDLDRAPARHRAAGIAQSEPGRPVRLCPLWPAEHTGGDGLHDRMCQPSSFAGVRETRRRKTSPVAIPRTPPSGSRNAVSRAMARPAAMSGGKTFPYNIGYVWVSFRGNIGLREYWHGNRPGPGCRAGQDIYRQNDEFATTRNTWSPRQGVPNHDMPGRACNLAAHKNFPARSAVAAEKPELRTRKP